MDTDNDIAFGWIVGFLMGITLMPLVRCAKRYVRWKPEKYKPGAKS